jgi:hypothetical protein
MSKVKHLYIVSRAANWTPWDDFLSVHTTMEAAERAVTNEAGGREERFPLYVRQATLGAQMKYEIQITGSAYPEEEE